MHLWRLMDSWQQAPLETVLYLRGLAGGGVVVGAEKIGTPLGTLIRFTENGVPRAALITPPGAPLVLNGYPQLGVTVLEDRDEISVAGERLLFARHESPAETVFPAGGPEARCARCKAVVNPGDACVRCPACAAYHHEREDLRCWTYQPTCGCSARLRAELTWHPAEDEDETER